MAMLPAHVRQISLAKGVQASVATLRQRITFRPLVYGYSNARVRAMHAAFVGKELLREMLAARSVNEGIELLERTAYKEDIVPLSLKYKGEELVELALAANFAKFAQKLKKSTPKPGKKAVEAMLSRWDVRNIKTVMLGRKLGKKFEDISALLVPAGSLAPDELAQMAGAKDGLELFSCIRGSSFGRRMFEAPIPNAPALSGMRKAMLSQDEKTTELISTLLDGYYFHLTKDAVVPSDFDSMAVRRMLASEADGKNLSTVLRLRNSGAGAQAVRGMLVPGGFVKVQEFASMLDGGQFDARLAHVAGVLGIRKEIADYQAAKSISALEMALEKKAALESLHAMRRLQMGLGTIVGALLLKEQEISNIRKIIRGKALGLPHERIEQMLVIVE